MLEKKKAADAGLSPAACDTGEEVTYGPRYRLRCALGRCVVVLARVDGRCVVGDRFHLGQVLLRDHAVDLAVSGGSDDRARFEGHAPGDHS